MNKKIKIHCENCNKFFEKYISQCKKSKTNKFFCSTNCKHKWMTNKTYEEILGKEKAKSCKEKLSIAFSKENNPRYIDGNTFKKFYCECGKEKDRRALQCTDCSPRGSFAGRAHSTEAKKQIGIRSRAKFTLKFKKNFRKTMEENGNWIRLIDINEYKFYCRLSSWNRKMFDIIEENQELLSTYRVFNCFSNTHGVVRDLRFEKQEGFEMKIFPELLRHPANCQIILHSENVSKRHKIKSSITLKELFFQIENYTKPWHEQKLCIKLISKYRRGFRYNSKYYKEENYGSLLVHS